MVSGINYLQKMPHVDYVNSSLDKDDKCIFGSGYSIWHHESQNIIK